MSCNNNRRNNPCCPDTPYPQVSHESVPSLIDNLVFALYGEITKTVRNGRVIWNIPCDPVTSPATIAGIPRETGEGLLCYIIRVGNSGGFIGATGPIGLTGATGATGPQGNAGPVGGQRWAYVGNGSQAIFNILGATTTNPLGYSVNIDGITQDPANYSVSSGLPYTLTMSSPVPVGSEIVIVSLNGIQGATGLQGTPGGATGATGVGAQGSTGATGVLPPTNFGGAWSYTGNGTQTVFAITGGLSILAPAYLVHVDGVYQKSTNYIIDNVIPRTLTFSTPIPSGSEITIVSLSVA